MATDPFPPLPDAILTQSQAGSSQIALSDDGPPLPPQLPGPGPGPGPLVPALTTSKLRKGTWLFTWNKNTDTLPGIPNPGLIDGTFRFDPAPAGPISLTARGSGDMYKRPVTFIPRHKVGNIWIGPLWIPGPTPAKDQGIPIFALSQYEGYLRVTGISVLLINNNSFDLEFEKYKWNSTTKAFAVDGSGAAVIEETYVVRMTWSTGDAGWPHPTDYMTGQVKVKSTGVSAGNMNMGWVSDKWRKIGLEIDAVKGCTFPLQNAARQSIWQLLEAAGFQMGKQIADETSIADTPDSVWSNSELHAAMLLHRQNVDLDKEWTYHALMIPKYTTSDTLGIMYDDIAWGSDTNKIAREGFAVAAHLQTGDASDWGIEANRRLQDAQDSFVRTTIHELSHAMGMQHPNMYSPAEEMDDTYTCQTWSLTQHARERGIVYPSNIQWRHSASVQKRLRHYPDIRIRPGGVQFSQMSGANGAAPWVPAGDIAPTIPGLTIELKPLMGEVPLGAPVRVEVLLNNDTEFPIEVPGNITLKGEAMKGDVQDSSGVRRPYQQLTHCIDMSNPLTTLDPGKSMTADMTLFAGNQGPLFPSTGVHIINAILSWNQMNSNGDTTNFWLEAQTTVMVTGARSSSHAAAAHRLLTEPQAFLSIVLAGDHLRQGTKAIQQACEDETLGPHYAYVEARRCAQRFMGRKPDCERAKKLLSRKGIVMSDSEKKKLDRLIKAGS